MYYDFFQFRKEPFNLTPDPDFLYLSPSHQEALEHLIYGVRERKGFVLMIGAIGLGKTTLTRLLVENLAKSAKTALVFNTFLNEIELLRAINREFGLSAEETSREKLILILNQFLLEEAKNDRNVVLILDEAQNLSVPVLEQVRMLSNLETADRKLIQIILAGQPELARTLGRPDLAQLNQRISVRCRLEPLNQADCVQYVHHRLAVAGPRHLARFSPQSLQWIHRFSGGVPRRINALCDRTLLAAFSRGTHEITPAFVRQAQSELTGEPSSRRWPGLPGRRRIMPALAILICLLAALYLGLAHLPTVRP